MSIHSVPRKIIVFHNNKLHVIVAIQKNFKIKKNIDNK